MTTPAIFEPLQQQGFNLQAVFDLHQLPAALAATVIDLSGSGVDWTQVLLIGHAGRDLWCNLPAVKGEQDDPIDRYTINLLDFWFAKQLPGHRYVVIYPGHHLAPMHALAERAGWYFPSPLGLGVNRRWGSWFAYRALIVTDTRLPGYSSAVGGSACNDCSEKPCLAACEGQLLDGESPLTECCAFRVLNDSPCAAHCAARWACPVAQDARYSTAQMRYHYQQSLAMLRRWRGSY